MQINWTDPSTIYIQINNSTLFATQTTSRFYNVKGNMITNGNIFAILGFLNITKIFIAFS